MLEIYASITVKKKGKSGKMWIIFLVSPYCKDTMTYFPSGNTAWILGWRNVEC